MIAIDLLWALIARQRNVRYVLKNSAPRAVYEAKLTGTFTKNAHQRPLQWLGRIRKPITGSRGLLLEVAEQEEPAGQGHPTARV